MKDKKALAVIVGEAWAKRMLDKQVSDGATVRGEFAGVAEFPVQGNGREAQRLIPYPTDRGVPS
jgi:hypothetical protein